jgi:small subunit ribosomal protein S9
MDIPKNVKSRVSTTAKNAPVAHGVGRRKAAVARVWVTRGKGSVAVNGKEVPAYFVVDVARTAAVSPLVLMPAIAKQYDVEVNICGGGICAQADAMKLGIARALVDLHDDARSLLRSNDMLTVDSRVKERKKYGQKAARRKFQFVKR